LNCLEHGFGIVLAFWIIILLDVLFRGVLDILFFLQEVGSSVMMKKKKKKKYNIKYEIYKYKYR
jgi:hypothetical protein